MYISFSHFKCDGEQLVTIFCIIAFHIFEDSFKHCPLYSKLNSTCSYPSLTGLFFFENLQQIIFDMRDTQSSTTEFLNFSVIDILSQKIICYESLYCVL